MVFHAAGNIGNGGAACEELDELAALIHEIDNIRMIDRIVARALRRFDDLRINFEGGLGDIDLLLAPC